MKKSNLYEWEELEEENYESDQKAVLEKGNILNLNICNVFQGQ